MAQSSSYEYPAGHQNHLNTDQIKALEEFKDLCREGGLYTPAGADTTASHSDETLLRFLRARKFVPGDAFQQLRSTETWRREQRIEENYDSIDIDEYEETRLLYTHWTGRRDKRGIPLYVFNIGDLDAKKISAAESSDSKERAPDSLSPKLRRLFSTYEHLTEFVFTLCSKVETGRPYPETPISQTCNIVDISGVSLRQFWNLRSHLQDASVLATAHYPETLGRTFIVGAPSFFPTVWSYLSYWFDPITVAKISVLPRSEVESTLKRYIETCNIPMRYGGTLDWEFGQLPILEPEILKVMQMNDGVSTTPLGPIRWKQNAGENKVEAHALGTVAGRQRDLVFAHIPSDIFNKQPEQAFAAIQAARSSQDSARSNLENDAEHESTRQT